MVDTGATHNFMTIDEAVRLGVKWSKKDGWMKRSGELLSYSLGRFQGSLGYELHETSLNHTHACVELGMHSREGITVHDSGVGRKNRWDEATIGDAAHQGGEEGFLALMKVEDEPNSVEYIPQIIEMVLEENKDVMPAKLPEKLPQRRAPNHHLWHLIEWLHPSWRSYENNSMSCY
ncbi:hypothetical protein Bca52824_075471 [Brassica carinata]|uniref:Uncharacterized protein n=1 Tax=Brassica carinata TaxID=52824 RepID=A0A8X7PS77_BRACI|nr:hypothetical protein Bca52824_075471 [Brassica carinata]